MIESGRVQSCHCGRPVHVYGDGFTRDMCEDCSAYRCDIEPSCPLPPLGTICGIFGCDAHAVIRMTRPHEWVPGWYCAKHGGGHV